MWLLLVLGQKHENKEATAMEIAYLSSHGGWLGNSWNLLREEKRRKQKRREGGRERGGF